MSRLLLLAVLASLVGCANPTSEPPRVDPNAIGSCGGPTSELGVDEGSGFAPMMLATCDGEGYAFYGDDEGYCEAELTVVAIAAGWCAPCLRETAELEAEIAAEYGGRGVRVVQVLVEDHQYRETSAEYCESWRERFDLTLPVLRDPNHEIQAYYPGGALPATLVVDGSGTIVHRVLGADAGLASLRAALDEFVAP